MSPKINIEGNPFGQDGRCRVDLEDQDSFLWPARWRPEDNLELSIIMELLLPFKRSWEGLATDFLKKMRKDSDLSCLKTIGTFESRIIRFLPQLWQTQQVIYIDSQSDRWLFLKEPYGLSEKEQQLIWLTFWLNSPRGKNAYK